MKRIVIKTVWLYIEENGMKYIDVNNPIIVNTKFEELRGLPGCHVTYVDIEDVN